MDVVAASQLAAVLSRLADGALGEAGKQAWEAIARLVGRTRRPGSQAPVTTPQAPVTSPGEALAELATHPGDVTRAEAAGRALERLAAADPEFAALLREWWMSTDRLVRDRDAGSVNVIRGDVHGPAVQARDIHGPISFGEGRPAS